MKQSNLLLPSISLQEGDRQAGRMMPLLIQFRPCFRPLSAMFRQDEMARISGRPGKVLHKVRGILPVIKAIMAGWFLEKVLMNQI